MSKSFIKNLVTGEVTWEKDPELTPKERRGIKRFVNAQKAQAAQERHRKAIKEGRF